jgi:hypothetical protein
MEIIFIGLAGAILFFTGLWKVVALIFFIWWLAFIVSENRQKAVKMKGFKITAPQLSELKRPAFTVNYFGPVW